MMLKKLEDALDFLTKAEECFEEDEFCLKLVDNLIKLSNFEDALIQIEEGIGQNSKNIDLLMKRAEIHF